MNEKQINIIFADDDETQHDALKNIVSETNIKSSDFKLNILQRFTNTNALKKYLSKKDNVEPDLLLLDIEFKGGESGIEALEMIRKFFSGQITLLSAYNDSKLVSPAIKKYHVKHLNKPLNPDDLINHLTDIEDQKNKFEEFINGLKKEYEKKINELEEDNEETIPKSISDYIGNLFRHIEFHKKALKEFVSCSDYRILQLLKNIDSGSETNGMEPKKFYNEIRNYNNLMEYRFSRQGRLFVFNQNDKKLIVKVDPGHNVAG